MPEVTVVFEDRTVKKMTTFSKTPASALTYTVDWTDWLESETISSSAWLCGKLTFASPAVSGSQTSVLVSGGNAGEVCTVTNRIVSSGGQTAERSFQIRIVESISL